MTVTGIDRALAKKAGNRVRREGTDTVLYDGRTGEQLAARYNIWTGFDLNRVAVGYSWAFSVRADDNRGVYNFEWDDADKLGFKRSWRKRIDDTTDHRGATHVGRVTKGIAFVPNGVICTSGYPTDAIYIPR